MKSLDGIEKGLGTGLLVSALADLVEDGPQAIPYRAF